jgi:beta-lactamase superfamily II metal-dependent hydrolase
MQTAGLGKALDPKFPDYIYAAKPLTKIFEKAGGGKGLTNLFLGEWMKVLDEPVSPSGWVRVRYRGGEGYVSTADVTRERLLEIFFIDVSQGDAILIQTPDDRRILIDGGESDDAYEFIRNKYGLDKPDNYIDFDAVIATHCDSDHTQGLIKVLEDPKIAVKRFYHNGLFRRTDQRQDPGPHEGKRVYGLVDRPGAGGQPALARLMQRVGRAIDQAEMNLPLITKKMADLGRRVDVPSGGFVCKRLDAADRYLPPYDDPRKPLVIEVLWPKAVMQEGRPSYPWYGDAGRTVNGNSVTLCLRHGPNRMLLAGDLNAAAMDDLLAAYPDEETLSGLLEAHVYKAAHHGSQDFSIPFLKAVKPNAAVISSGDDTNDIHGHPRAVLVGTITRYSRCERPAVFITELAACFTKLAGEEKEGFTSGKVQLYERSIQGIIHLRSGERSLWLGSVHGRKAAENEDYTGTAWKWDVWSQDL